MNSANSSMSPSSRSCERVVESRSQAVDLELASRSAPCGADELTVKQFYREELSCRPDEAIKLMRGARYPQVSIYRNRPGFGVDFNQLIRMRKAALDRVNADRPELGYQIISGANTGTYIFIAPFASPKILDDLSARWWRTDGPADGPRGAGRQIAAEGDITREHLLFRVEPRWSWIPEDRSR